MPHSTGSNPQADSHTAARIAAAQQAAEAAEQAKARITRLHAEAARDYQSQAAARAQHNAANR